MNETPANIANDVFIRVFLSSDMRTRFKVACAQSGVAKILERAKHLRINTLCFPKDLGANASPLQI
jgi:hypothetical protein